MDAEERGVARTRQRWARVAVITGIWTVLGLLAGSQSIAYRAYGGQEFYVGRAIARGLLEWYSFGIFTPFIIWIARRYELSWRNLLRTLPEHLLACAALLAIKPAVYLFFSRAAGWQDAGYVNRVLYADLFAVIAAYWSVVGATYAVDYYERFRERQLRASQLESRLSRVQLDALKAQIHPHFLFNALNAVSALMHRDVAAADRMVLELGELLRHTLSEASAQEVSLGEELRIVDRYLAIMQIRLGDRLRVVKDVDADTMSCLVPNLLLQPIVENALTHGIGRSASAGLVEISAHTRGDVVEITVRDDGPGVDRMRREGIGLRNTRMRMEQLYGSRFALELSDAPGGGAMTRIEVPVHTIDVDALQLARG